MKSGKIFGNHATKLLFFNLLHQVMNDISQILFAFSLINSSWHSSPVSVSMVWIGFNSRILCRDSLSLAAF